MEPQPMYRWNGTPLVIPADPKIAEAYNRRNEQFIEAQKQFKKENGRPWTFNDSLLMPQDEEAQKAYEDFGDLLNALVRFSGGGINFPEEMMDGTNLVRID